MLTLATLLALSFGHPSDLTVDFVNDYTPAAANGVPPRAVYRRGADVCCAVVIAPSDDAKRVIRVEAGKSATFKTAKREYTLALESVASQTLTPPKGRRGQLKVVYTGLPDAICAGTLSLPVTVKRGDDVVWEKIETQLFLVEGRPLVPGVVDGLDVLAEAVKYADGMSRTEAVCAAVADGLFRSGRFKYDDKQSVSAFDTATGKCDLARLKPGKEALPANCYQLSNYLGVLLGSLGVESELREIILDHETTKEFAFKTTPVVPIGTANDKPGGGAYSPLTMFSHQFLLVGGKVYDCSYAPERTPVGEAWGRPVSGWSLAEYLGETPGQGGAFVAGTPTGKRARLFVERGEIPLLNGTNK